MQSESYVEQPATPMAFKATTSTRLSSRLAEKRHREPEKFSPVPPNPPKKKRKTNAESCREYRLKRKVDPARYTEHCEKTRAYSQDYRRNMSEERRLTANHQAKFRMRAMRERKKAEQGPAKSTRQSEEAKDAQRKEWREQKRRQRAELKKNKKKLAWVNRKRRENYAEKKQEMVNQNADQPCSSQTQTVHGNAENHPEEQYSSFSEHTPQARRKALNRARAALPNSPQKYVNTVNDLIQKATPRKKKMFQQHAEKLHGEEVKIGKNVMDKLHSLNRSRSKSSLMARKLFLSVCGEEQSSARSQSFTFKCARKTLLKYKKSAVSSFMFKSEKLKHRKKKLEDEVKHFMATNSVSLPQKKLVSQKTGLHALVLCKPLTDLHKLFKEATGNDISFAHFAKCRPSNVRLARHNLLRQCLCEYCENVNLKIPVINSMAGRINNNSRIRHLYHAADLVTCGRNEGRWQKECAYGTCDNCGPQQLDQHLQPLHQHQGPLMWKRWENRPTIINGKRTTRKMLVTRHGIVADLVEEMKEELTFLTGHLYRADWQYAQFLSMRQQQPFPQHMVLMVLDFAENFSCKFQDEVQAAHWYYEQATVHPTVCYYACPACKETVTESLVFISDDKVHDFHAVHQFNTLAVKHLRGTRGLDINSIVQWSDGCASQYKSKGPFADISCALEDFGCTFERNYFGSRHGKGPSDGESAVVKSGAARAVRNGGAIISTAQELFQYLENSSLKKQPLEGQCDNHSFRTFFLVPSGSMSRNRNRALVKTVKGTRQLQCVRCLKEKELLTRKLTCSCDACMSGFGVCDNITVVGPWTKEILRPACADEQEMNQQDKESQPPEEGTQPPEEGEETLQDHELQDQVQQDGEPADKAVQDGPESIEEGDFVLVWVPGRKRLVPYYVKVVEKLSGQLKIRYLEKKMDSNCYVWSDYPIKDLITPADVVKKLPNPELAPGRELAFTFPS